MSARAFLLVVAALALTAICSAQAAAVLLPGCTANMAGDRPTITCPKANLLGVRDIQGGNVEIDPATGLLDRKKLNLNLGAGDHVNRGYVVLSPDVGRGTILEDGHLHKLLLVRAPRYGGTEFRTPVRFKQGMVACDRAGCVDVLARLRSGR